MAKKKKKMAATFLRHKMIIVNIKCSISYTFKSPLREYHFVSFIISFSPRVFPQNVVEQEKKKLAENVSFLHCYLNIKAFFYHLKLYLSIFELVSNFTLMILLMLLLLLLLLVLIIDVVVIVSFNYCCYC